MRSNRIPRIGKFLFSGYSDNFHELRDSDALHQPLRLFMNITSDPAVGFLLVLKIDLTLEFNQ